MYESFASETVPLDLCREEDQLKHRKGYAKVEVDGKLAEEDESVQSFEDVKDVSVSLLLVALTEST